MRLIDIYDFVIKKGIAKDPRTKKEIDEELNKARREFRNLRGPDKKYYDKDRLENPYADTRILYGNPDEDIKTMMIGVDMEVPEVLAADLLNERGESIDLVMAHHPEGAAWARFYDVMRLQVAMLRKFGIPPEIGKALLLWDSPVGGGTLKIAILSTGSLGYTALCAARTLAEEGIECVVLHVPTVKPLDTEAVLDVAKRAGRVVTIEEHQVAGGFGSAITEFLSEQYPVPIHRLGIQDQFGQSGQPDELLAHYGLDVLHIADAIRAFIHI